MPIKSPTSRNGARRIALSDQMRTLMNLCLIFIIAVVALNLVLLLLSGKLTVYANMVYATWIGMVATVRYFLGRRREGLPIKPHAYVLGCLCLVLNLLLSWSFPISIILSVLAVITCVISYRASNRRVRHGC